MSCCGKNVVKVARILGGNLAVMINDMRLLPKQKSEKANSRLNGCRKCENATWMTWIEYWEWVDSNGGKIKFFAEIDDLGKWPLLPEQEYITGRKLFCKICKCWLPAKCFAENEKCPIQKWS